MSTYKGNTEKLTQEINLVCDEFFSQYSLKEEYLHLKEQHKKVISLIEGLTDDLESHKELICKYRVSLYKIRDYYKTRRNLIADMIQDEAWLYANLT